jgi:integrase
LDNDEILRVWEALENEREWGDFFRVLILTGARRDAFCSMRWRDLNLDAGVWAVPVEWAKSKREMAVPLCSGAARILRARKEASCAQLKGNGDWVWPSAESAIGHITHPEKSWRRVLKAARVEHATFHDLRRTMGSRLAMSGVADATISKVLGHLSPQSLKHYLHLDTNAGKEAIDRVYAPIVDKPKHEIIVVAVAKDIG